tara:strand:- start:73 stop:612 length:540 start_codon:yes stop_codon:yes gene_type:complete
VWSDLLYLDGTSLVDQAIAMGMLRAFEPPVDSPRQTVSSVLGVFYATETRCENMDVIGAKITIQITGMDEVRRFDEEYAVMGWCDRPGEDQILKKGNRPIHSAVVVVVDQDDDSSDRTGFITPIDVVHVPTHLDHPQATGGVEAHRDGILHQGFGSDEFDRETGRQGERLGFLLGGPGW